MNGRGTCGRTRSARGGVRRLATRRFGGREERSSEASSAATGPAMRVVERMWKDGENLVWQATVEDPTVLTAPWTMPARVTKPSTEPLEESPKCVETDGHKLLNDDHHLQR